MADTMPHSRIAVRLVVLAAASTLLAVGCGGPRPASITGFEIRRVQVPQAPGDETYNVTLGAELSRAAASRARNVTASRDGQGFFAAEQEEARLLVEEELRRMGLCKTGIDVVRRLLHFDHNPDTEIVVRCLNRGA